MLNEWSDRAPPKPVTRRDRLRQLVMLTLLTIMLLTVGGGLIMQIGGLVRQLLQWAGA